MTPEEHSELLIIARVINRGDATGLQLQSWLDAHPPVPSVPVSELRAWQNRDWVDGEFAALLDKHDPPSLPPNPHQQGTYLWAREEHARGDSVRRHDWNSCCTARGEWLAFMFTHADFTATDWEVVK